MADNNNQVRQSQVVQTGPTQVEQIFGLPIDIKDVSLKEESRFTILEDDGADVTVTVENPSTLPRLYAPTWMTVIGQQVRWTGDGLPVMDVTVEFEDVPGANAYDIRISRQDASDDTVLGI